MGGKTSTSTNQVSIPPEVLARYNSVNATAENVAQTPFQQYSTNPNAFVAPLTPTQTAGVQNTNTAAGMAQPYFQAGTGFALAGAQPVNAAPLDTSKYMNPYLSTVLGSTEAMVNQQNQQAQAGQTGNAINQGYFGGDRAGIAAAVLQGQQELAGGQLYSGIASDAYQQAMAAAQQQQGVNLGAAQANRQALQETGQSLAGLGTGAQGAALSGAQAQLGAGQVEQQTQQAGLTALYNQFLQQQSYPFQTAQFLANIAEGTGALSGSTTTTTQPQSIFSDERLKEDIEPIGKGFDGANIIRFRYRGDPTTRIGMSAQEVERRHPEAVSEHGGFKAVDYGAATDDAADRGGFAGAANDNDDDGFRRARQAGGMSGWGMYPSGANPMVIQQLLESQAQMYGPYGGEGGPGLYGHSASQIPHGGSGYVPAASLPVGQLQVAHPAPAPQQNLGSDIHQVANLADDAEGLKSDYHLGHEAFDWLTGRGGGGGGSGSGGGGDKDMNANTGGRIGRAPGGPTTADYATQARQARIMADIAAHNAAQHAAQAQQARQQRDAARAAAQPDTSFGGRGSILGATGLPAAYHGAAEFERGTIRDLGRLAHAAYGVQQGIQGAGAAAAPYVMSGLARLGNQPWFYGQAPGATPRYVTDPRAYMPPPAAAAPAAAPSTAASPAPAAAPAAAPPVHPAVHHAIQAARHASLAQQHAAAAQQLSAPTATAPGGTSSNLAGASGLPGGDLRPDPASTAPINVGDVSHLQGGFLPANLQQPHEGLFHRIGDWLGGHFGDAGQRANYDIEHHMAAAPVGSSGAAGPSLDPNSPLITGPAYSGLASAPVPPPAATPGHLDPNSPLITGPAYSGLASAPIPPPVATADTEPIPHEALQPHPRVEAINTAIDPDFQPAQTAARGGFARANGGASKNPWSAVDSGSSNLSRPRASRQAGGDAGRAHYDLGGGMPDPSNPQDDNPYKPQGPGLNIPTAETQHPKLATASPPSAGGGGGGLGSAIGMGSDLVNIAKFALPFFGVPLQRGGRAGYATDGSVAPAPDDPDAPTTPAPAVHDPDATPVAAAADDDRAAPPPPPPPAKQGKQGGYGAAAPPGGGGGGFGGMLKNLIGAPIHALGEVAGYEGNGQWDRDRLMPFLSMIGAIGATPTVHPLFALSQGLGQYAKSYMGQQQAEQTLNLTNAQAQQARYQGTPASIRDLVGVEPGVAMTPDGRFVDNQRTFRDADGKPYHYVKANQMVSGLGAPPGGGGGGPQAGVAGSPGSAGIGQMTAPTTSAFNADYSAGGLPKYTIGPSSDTAQRLAQYGVDPNAQQKDNEINTAWSRPSADMLRSESARADDFAGQPGQLYNDQRNFRAMVNEAVQLPDKGLGAVGPGQGERQLLLQAANTWGKMLDPNFKGFADIDANSSNTEILNKLATLQSDALAGHFGQRSLTAAQDLRNVMPGGDLQKASIYKIVSQMMIANQKALDFNEYRQNYQRFGLGDFGVIQAYQRDTQDLYEKETAALPGLMTRLPGSNESVFEHLEKHPEDIKRFEQGYDANVNGRTVHIDGYGPGFGKLFT